MKCFDWIGMLVLLAFAACHNPTREAWHMVHRAEQLADTLPDSTIRLIDSVLRLPVNLSERERMDLALLQAETLFERKDDACTISSVMDDDFFDDHDNISTSPELERAAAYYAGRKQYAKAAKAALYSGFVQQHYNEKETAMQSFKDAEHYGKIVRDSLTMAQAEYWMGKMLYYGNRSQESLVLLKSACRFFGNCNAEKALTLNVIAACHIVLGEYENAELCLQQSLQFSERDEVGKIKRKALNNYAVLCQLQDRHNHAIACLRQIGTSVNLDDTEILLQYMNIGDVFFEINNMDSAAFYYKRVDSLLPLARVKMESKASAYNSLAQFAESQQDNVQALRYWKQYDKWLNESRDMQEQNNVYAVQRKYDYGVLRSTMDKKIIERQRLIIVLSVVVVLILMGLIIAHIRLARIRRQETEIKESLIRYMRQNEEFKNAIEDNHKKLSKAFLKEQQIMQKMAVYLGNTAEVALFDSLKYSIFGGREYWEAMQKAFDQQFPNVRKKIVQQHPELTDTELKILLLSYVDASREDTALLLHTSVYMVDKLRTSIKKKMATDASDVSGKA